MPWPFSKGLFSMCSAVLLIYAAEVLVGTIGYIHLLNRMERLIHIRKTVRGDVIKPERF